MPAFVVILSNAAESSQSAARSLHEMHAGGAITLFGMSAVSRDVRTRGIRIDRPIVSANSLAVPSLSAAISAMVVLLGGAQTAAAASTETGMQDALSDLASAGLSTSLLHLISESLHPGAIATLAEIEDEERERIDTLLTAASGLVLRQERPPFPEEEFIRQVLPLTTSALLDGRQAAIRTRQAARLSTITLSVRREVQAKLTVLRAQALGLAAEQRMMIERRADRIRAVTTERIGRLQDLARTLSDLQSSLHRYH